MRLSFKPPFDQRADVNETTVVTNKVIRTRYGRAAVAGAALLSSGLLLSARTTRTNLGVVTAAQPTGDPCYVDGTEDFPQGLQNVAGYEKLGLPSLPLG